MKKLLFAIALSTVLFACDEDEKIEVKDYGMKKFEADMKYDAKAPHGQIKYTQQVFMKLGQDEPVALGEYGTDTWTTFCLTKDKEGIPFNDQTKVKGWDFVFTQFYRASDGYGVSGNLINTEEGIEIGLLKYEDSKEAAKISEAFAMLTLEDVKNVSDYKSNIDAIPDGEWKAMHGMPPSFSVNTHHFYVVKLKNNDTYKLRFLSFYGETKAERIMVVEYALMK